MRTFRLLWLLLIIAALPGPARARLQVVIDDPNFQPFPLAIPNLKSLGGGAEGEKLSQQAAEMLRGDLELSDFFKVVPLESYLEDPKTAGITRSTIDFGVWFQVGAEGLIKGGLELSGDTVRLDLRLFEVARGEQSLARKYSGKKSQLSRLIHGFADELIQHLAGERGVFSTRIVCVRKTKGIKQIYVMDTDGRNGRTLTQNASINILPTWSHDGARIFFTSYIAHNPDLWSVPTSGGNPTPVSQHRGLNVGAHASPDGGWIALTLSRDGNSEIYKMRTDGSGLKRLTHSMGIDSSAAWSPDGSRIAFVSSRSGNPHIYLMGADGSGQTRLTFVGTYNQTPEWSPRGGKIAFTARDERNVFDLFVIDTDTRQVKRLTQDQGNNEDPTWAPSGRFLALSSTRDGGPDIFVMNEDGSKQQRISRGAGGFTTPAWSPWTATPFGEKP